MSFLEQIRKLEKKNERHDKFFIHSMRELEGNAPPQSQTNDSTKDEHRSQGPNIGGGREVFTVERSLKGGEWEPVAQFFSLKKANKLIDRSDETIRYRLVQRDSRTV